MRKYKWFLESPWVFVLTGALLVLASVTKQIVVWETKFTLFDNWLLHLAGYAGGVAILVGLILALCDLRATESDSDLRLDRSRGDIRRGKEADRWV